MLELDQLSSLSLLLQNVNKIFLPLSIARVNLDMSALLFPRFMSVNHQKPEDIQNFLFFFFFYKIEDKSLIDKDIFCSIFSGESLPKLFRSKCCTFILVIV